MSGLAWLLFLLMPGCSLSIIIQFSMTKYSNGHPSRKRVDKILTLKSFFGRKKREDILSEAKTSPIPQKMVYRDYANTYRPPKESQGQITKYFQEKPNRYWERPSQPVVEETGAVEQEKIQVVSMIEEDVCQLTQDDRVILKLQEEKQRLKVRMQELKKDKQSRMISMSSWREDATNTTIQLLQKIRQNNKLSRAFSKTEAGTICAPDHVFSFLDSPAMIKVKNQIQKIQNQVEAINSKLETSGESNPGCQRLLEAKKSLIAQKRKCLRSYNQLLIKKKETIRKYKLSKKEELCSLAKENWEIVDYNLFPIELIGVGGFSEVYKCYNLKQECYVGMKISMPAKNCEPEEFSVFSQLMIQEFKIQKGLLHENIGVALEQFTVQNCDYFYNTFQLYEGPELSDYIEHLGCVEEAEAKELLRQILNGVEYLHDNGVIHYDLKSKNIIFHQDSLKIIDFGVSKKLKQGETKIKLENIGFGTFSCLPPETVMEEALISTKVDMYSVGVLYYQLLYGKKPFHFPTYYHALHSMLNPEFCDIRFPASGPNESSVSPEAQQFILKCLKYLPEDRYSVKEALTSEYLSRQMMHQ